MWCWIFLSTPSARRATVLGDGVALRVQISIHALREEGDRVKEVRHIPQTVISIHALREEGDARKARKERECKISIHALREEGDADCSSRLPGRSHFYPRPPRGGRPPVQPRRMVGRIFLSTPSARRATCR